MPWSLLLCIHVVGLVYLKYVMNKTLIRVLLKRWMCFIQLFYVCDCNATYVLLCVDFFLLCWLFHTLIQFLCRGLGCVCW
jgi:hypothetical protein